VQAESTLCAVGMRKPQEGEGAGSLLCVQAGAGCVLSPLRHTWYAVPPVPLLLSLSRRHACVMPGSKSVHTVQEVGVLACALQVCVCVCVCVGRCGECVCQRGYGGGVCLGGWRVCVARMCGRAENVWWYGACSAGSLNVWCACAGGCRACARARVKRAVQYGRCACVEFSRRVAR